MPVNPSLSIFVFLWGNPTRLYFSVCSFGDFGVKIASPQSSNQTSPLGQCGGPMLFYRPGSNEKLEASLREA